MKLFRWEGGRQAGGYEKMQLAKGPRFDLFMIRYRCGASVAPHVDPAPPGWRHFRANLMLRAPRRGGRLALDKAIYAGRRLTIFRPDQNTHWVTTVEEGSRLMLSLGWLRPGGGQG